MWRTLVSSHLKSIANCLIRPVSSTAPLTSIATRSTSSIFNIGRSYSVDTSADTSSIKKWIEKIMPIATGHEREELEAELQGKDILESNNPVGPFGTKEAPAVVKSFCNKRIVGCPGGESEDEHDIVWFWLEKGKPVECPVCTQYFELDVVGPGGPPDGHGDDDHH